jgi:hypothetical protein
MQPATPMSSTGDTIVITRLVRVIQYHSFMPLLDAPDKPGHDTEVREEMIALVSPSDLSGCPFNFPPRANP